MSPPPDTSRPQRFYREVTAEPDGYGRFRILLDARALRTPRGLAVVLPTLAAADRLAVEWREQDATIDLGRMAVTRLVFTAIDREAAREAWIEEVVRYAASDLLLHVADGPDSLVAQQNAQWSPWLVWARDVLGAELSATIGIMPRRQDPAALEAVRRAAAAGDEFTLVALVAACGLFGSAVLALAMAQGALTGAAAHALARLDEAWQESQWGEDDEAAARTALRLTEACELDAWFAALRAA